MAVTTTNPPRETSLLSIPPLADLEKAWTGRSASSSTTEIADEIYSPSLGLRLYSESPVFERTPSRESIFWTIYRQLFSAVLLANLPILIWILICDRNIIRVIDAVAVNFLCCALARQPFVVNGFFITFCSIPKSLPLWVRRKAANIHQYGGVHSGCGVTSLLWYLAMVVLMTRNFCIANTHSIASTIALALSYIIILLLVAVIGVSYPAFRACHPTVFELTHRYCAWLIVAFFLAFLVVFAKAAYPQSQGEYLINLPAFWCICLSALVTVQPWTRLRQIPVRTEVLSSHTLRLHLPGSTSFGKIISLSRHPVHDWRNFATFPDPTPTSSVDSTFSLIVSRTGGLKSSIIASNPTSIYTRGQMTYGFTHVMRLFHRIVLVATGSGIGSCLSFLAEKHRRPALRLLWQTRAPLWTYGSGVLAQLHQLVPDPMIVDTEKCGGRIDLVPVIADLYHETQAEMVCVIGNQRLTEEVVCRLRNRGIAAMGPLFDS
ncbi:hypothetical protein N7454_005911 [Penicillium verhagenii]|nr:hypothetical protein N7454_005911 [Penicillium verhagenii]